jgi:alkylated DNA repair dioxygenase AlkB
VVTPARDATPPAGFRYQADLLPPGEEAELVAHIRALPLKEFEFQGYLARRRVCSFGWHYDFADGALRAADELPSFLLALRQRAADFGNLAPADLSHALITEYSPGAAIGWHRDKGVFDDVIGVSLLSACNFRLRRRAGAGWERYSVTVEPRSVYLLRGSARSEWEHSIPAVETHRYSVTFRSLRGRR